MSTFAFLALCIQACLIQNAYSQCLSGAYAPGFSAPGAYAFEAALAGPAAYVREVPAAIAAYPAAAGLGAYGGSGVGDVAVAGEMGVAGTTLVAGQVPILGAVDFGGMVPAAGAVTIAGSCGCGRGPYLY